MVLGSGQGGGIGALLGGAQQPQSQAPQAGGLGDLAQMLLQQIMMKQQLGGALDRRAGQGPAMGPPPPGAPPMGAHSPQRMFQQTAMAPSREERVGDPGYGGEPYPPGGPYGAQQAPPPRPMPTPTPEEQRIERHMQDIAPNPQRQQEIQRLMNEIDALMQQPDSPEKMDRIMTIQQEIERLKSGE